MRFATVHGLFKASRSLRMGQGPEATMFSNNALSACLREDHLNCQKHAVRCPYLPIEPWHQGMPKRQRLIKLAS